MANVAEAYHQWQSGYQSKDGVDLIDKLSLKRGSVVLDIGCGTGYLSSVLAERVGHEGRVVGVDPKEKRLQVAKREYGQITNLKFTAGNSDNFPSGSYDVIFANHVLHWIQDKESAFKKVYENLKVGGKFAFLCPSEPPQNKCFELLNPKIGESLFYWKATEYESLARECGFEIEFEFVGPECYKFENMDKYIEWALATIDVNLSEVDPKNVRDMKNQITGTQFDWTKIQFILKRTE